jgi:hypothetical protein
VGWLSWPPRRCYVPDMNLGWAMVISAATIAAVVGISHRYEIRATSCEPSETACSRLWRVDQWTGAMTFCEYKGGLFPTSPPIGEPLAFDTQCGFGEALVIVHAERHTLVVAEIELAEIALQVLLRHVVINTSDAALQDREIVLNRVRMPKAAANAKVFATVNRS